MDPIQHLYLTGYRGTGKSAVGLSLASLLDRPAIDLDQVIELNCGKSIREIFDEGGEALFRDLESEALVAVSESDAAVISLGGGAILKQENRDIVRRTGICVWLRAKPETIVQRINADASTRQSRPPLTSLDPLAEIREMLRTRHSLYDAVSEYQIDTDRQSAEQVANEVVRAIEAELTGKNRGSQ